jgi:hypothetical protein
LTAGRRAGVSRLAPAEAGHTWCSVTELAVTVRSAIGGPSPFLLVTASHAAIDLSSAVAVVCRLDRKRYAQRTSAVPSAQSTSGPPVAQGR